jgi:uncharacterized membrane protein YfcA
MGESAATAALLFLAGLGAGWIDSIAGGGGLITVPVLLAIGLPPQAALGTNKLQACFGSFTAAHHYTHEQVVNLEDARLGILLTAIGAVLGSWSVQQIDPAVLKIVIPFLLILIALYMLFTPQVGEREVLPRIRRSAFYLVFGVGLGFYDGFFGPGVGSFWAIAMVVGLGFGLRRATGYTKVMNLTSNVVSFVVFLIGGHIVWAAGLTMAAGQIVGARIGSGLVIRRGVRFIRPIYIGVVILTTVKLLYDQLV